MDEFAANVDGESTGKSATSREAVDGQVFIECGQLVREQAVERTKQVKRGAGSSNKAKTHLLKIAKDAPPVSRQAIFTRS
jgi:hypothetical protein